MLTSARGQPYADVIMAFDDVSVDSINIDQVNGRLGSMAKGQLGPHVSLTESLAFGPTVQLG